MIEHGTRWGYSKGCRCDSCREAATIAQRKYRRRKALTCGPLLVDARPARHHLKVLRKAGFSWRVIGAATGHANSNLVRIYTGKTRSLSRVTADRILGASLSDCRSVSRGRKPSAESYKLLEEFLAAGYNSRWVRAQVNNLDLTRRTPTLAASTVERIQQLHDLHFWQNINGFRAHCKCACNPADPEVEANRKAKRDERARKRTEAA